jgi:uncharacterized RDD family membrane protein YckC
VSSGNRTRWRLAGLARRFLSLAYEALLLMAVLLVGGFAFTAFAGRLEPALARPALQVMLLLLAGGYFVWQWHRGGQTLPMKTWRMRLVKTAGEPLSVGHALRRFVFAATGTLLGCGGVIWAFFDRDRQFLHDRLAGTRIVMSDE